MTKTDAAVQTLSDINPDVVLEVNTLIRSLLLRDFITYVKLLYFEFSICEFEEYFIIASMGSLNELMDSNTSITNWPSLVHLIY
jgi:hypothetical protein